MIRAWPSFKTIILCAVMVLPVVANAAESTGVIGALKSTVISAIANVFDPLLRVIDWLLGAAMLGFIMFALLILGGICIFIALMADLLITIAIAFGPLILALYPLLRNWLNQYLGFIAGAIMIKPVAALIVAGVVAGTSTVISPESMQALSGGALPKTSVAFGVLTFLIVMISVALQIQSMSQALFGGVSFTVPFPARAVGGRQSYSKRGEGTPGASPSPTPGASPSPTPGGLTLNKDAHLVFDEKPRILAPPVFIAAFPKNASANSSPVINATYRTIIDDSTLTPAALTKDSNIVRTTGSRSPLAERLKKNRGYNSY